MGKIEKLKKVEEVMKLKVGSINRELSKEYLPKMQRMKLEYERNDLLASIKNIEVYRKRLELIEKVRQYENNSRKS
jgi:hypothetical protein